MVLAVTFWSQPQVVTDSWVELAGTITLIAFVIGVYRHLECHKSGVTDSGASPTAATNSATSTIR